MLLRKPYTGYAVAYHVTEADNARQILSEQAFRQPVAKDTEWLGAGVYFWENSLQSCHKWVLRRRGRYRSPKCIKAVIELTEVLDLNTPDGFQILLDFQDKFKSKAWTDAQALSILASHRKIKGVKACPQPERFRSFPSAPQSRIYSIGHPMICVYDRAIILDLDEETRFNQQFP